MLAALSLLFNLRGIYEILYKAQLDLRTHPAIQSVGTSFSQGI